MTTAETDALLRLHRRLSALPAAKRRKLLPATFRFQTDSGALVDVWSAGCIAALSIVSDLGTLTTWTRIERAAQDFRNLVRSGFVMRGAWRERAVEVLAVLRLADAADVPAARN